MMSLWNDDFMNPQSQAWDEGADVERAVYSAAMDTATAAFDAALEPVKREKEAVDAVLEPAQAAYREAEQEAARAYHESRNRAAWDALPGEEWPGEFGMLRKSRGEYPANNTDVVTAAGELPF
jgi:hypothetical protein